MAKIETEHKVVSRAEWIEARKDLLAKEKEFTHRRDALSEERRKLPWVKVDKEYIFDTQGGKKTLTDLPSVAKEVRECEAALGNTGRVLVRFSGTEPLARVMVEASDQKQVEEFTARIAGAIEREIG